MRFCSFFFSLGGTIKLIIYKETERSGQGKEQRPPSPTAIFASPTESNVTVKNIVNLLGIVERTFTPPSAPRSIVVVTRPDETRDLGQEYFGGRVMMRE